MKFKLGSIFVLLASVDLYASNQASLKISEVRVDSLPPYTDVEYIELTGIAGTSLEGLSLIVIGRADASRSFGLNSGVVNSVIPLGGVIPPDRAFLIGNSTFMLFDQPDWSAETGLDDLENLSILLVEGQLPFQKGDDLDNDNDGVLDDFNFQILDSVATLWQPIGHPMGGQIYSDVVVGPLNGFVIFGTSRCLADETWKFLSMGYPSGSESPGDLGPVCLATICPGDLTNDQMVDGNDLALVLGSWGNFDGPYDFDQNGTVGLEDINFIMSSWGVCEL